MYSPHYPTTPPPHYPTSPLVAPLLPCSLRSMPRSVRIKIWEKNSLISGTFADLSRPQALSEEFISLEEIP